MDFWEVIQKLDLTILIPFSEEGPDKFHQSTDTDFWIGLDKVHPNGNWSWTDGSPFDFNDWRHGEPKNTTDANCASLSMTDLYWSAQNCIELKPYVCALAPSVPTTPPSPTYPTFVNCSDGWTYFQPTHSCYGVGKLGLTANWTAAENYCQKLNANLPSIHSFEEFRFLMSYVYEMWLVIWTGTYSVDGEVTWKNSNGSLADFLKWAPWCNGFPKNITEQSYIAIGNNGQDCYYDLNSSTLGHTLCKKQLWILPKSFSLHLFRIFLVS